MSIGFNISQNAIKNALYSQSVRAQNTANVNSRDYKEKQLVQEGADKRPAVKVDLSQNPVRTTDNAQDIAIIGKGYLVATNDKGEKHYAQSATFTLNNDKTLRDTNGHVLASLTGNPDEWSGLTVEKDGSITTLSSGTREPIKVGQLLVVSQDMETVSKESKVLQGALLDSNVDIATQIVGGMSDEANLKANTKTIKTQDDMLGDLIDLVG